MVRSVSRSLLAVLVVGAGAVAGEKQAKQGGPEKPNGREIFERVWTADDTRSHGGDGLGPVFNANSCVACHLQGGAGGAGGFEHNVQLLSVALPALPVKTDPPETQPGAGDPEAVRKAHEAAFETALAQARTNRETTRKQLVERFHPDFAESDTIVIHAKGTDEESHEAWRQKSVMATQIQQLGLGFIQPSNTIGSTVTPMNITDLTVPITGPVPANGFVNFGLAVNPSSFPVLTEMMGKVNQLRSLAHQGISVSTAFGAGAVLRTSQRNTTALWGAGLIDRIPAEAIEELAVRQKEAGGRISGRPHRFADGRLGRFGWKGQKATLHDFTMAACANELGLEVPGAKQAKVAYRKDYEPKGYDLNESEVDALVDYIASLPAPRRVTPKDIAEEHLADGAELFASIGCVQCHVETVGEAVGLYSDLLLHDMGADLGSVGSYGVPSIPESDPDDVPVADAKGAQPKAVPPTSREWRTAPLWGVASSAPYLHDGRAQTLEQAIAFHGGEAAEARLRFLLLSPEEQKQLLTFLGSLAAPEVASSK